MLKSYITTLQADTVSVICQPEQGHELAVTSLSIFGGANGGYITIAIGDFSMQHSIAANGRIVFPFFMGVTERYPMMATSNNDDIRVCVAAEQFVADSASDNPDEPESDLKPLTIIAEEDGATVALNYTANSYIVTGNFKHLKYKINDSGEWLQYEDDNAIITLPNKGDYVQFWNKDTKWCSFYPKTNNIPARTSTRKFVFTKNVSVAGNIRSLVNFEETGCFYSTFEGCVNLISAKNLVLDFVSVYCFRSLFTGCLNLIEIPKISITDFVEGCFSYMLNGCSGLQNVDVNFTSWDKDSEVDSQGNVIYTSATENWVSGVSATGTFYKPKALPEEYGVNRIPEGWSVVNVDEKPDTPDVDKPTLPTEEELTTPLTIVAEEDGVEVRLLKAENSNGLDVISLKYKVNNSQDWVDYNTTGTKITLAKAGDFVQFKNETTKFNAPDERSFSFDFSKKVSAKGNINSLINFSNNLEPGVFNCLFVFCKNLIDVKDLILPSLNLTKNCYYRMFFGTNITNAPKMLATSLADNSCHEMFGSISNLNQVTVYFTEWLGNKTYLKDATYCWVENVSSSGVFYKPSALTIEYGKDRIPEGWTVVNID